MARTLFRELAEIVRLEKGRHRRPQDGVCTMELVAWMSGEKHSDRPKSASPPAAPLETAIAACASPNRQCRGRARGQRGGLRLRRVRTRQP